MTFRPRLSAEPKRLALIENRDLINMALLGRASLPVDLMSYLSVDKQPSVFFLRETPRQSILTVFNWTGGRRSHTIALASLGLAASTSYAISDVLDGSPFRREQHGALQIDLPRHSVRVLKIVATGPAVAPRVRAQRVSSATTGAEVSLTAAAAGPEDAITSYLWDFGDGVTTRGAQATHAYTHEGRFRVTVRAAGVEGLSGEDTFSIDVSGQIPTTFVPSRNRRQHDPE